MNDKKNQFGLNESYVEILRAEWQTDPLSVPEEWRNYFAGNKHQSPSKEKVATSDLISKDLIQDKINSTTLETQKLPIIGIAKKIVENMELSLEIPTATSSRDIPVKVLEENRAVINDYLEDDARPRCSYTHLIAFALVQAIKANLSMNNGFIFENEKPFKLHRSNINLGLAIDLPGRDGGRSLVVPNIKSCQDMDFLTFFYAYNEVIDKARLGKLKTEDFANTTITLTNTGGIGTVTSIPRLMTGQGVIVATGRIGYPAQFEATSKETLQALGVGKVMTMTSTYDHRVIQGAESGKFLADISRILIGGENFYEKIFRAIKIPHHPYKLKADQAVVIGQHAERIQTERAMRVSQLIHAYRVRGYLLAHVDPLHLILREHPELDLQNYGLTIWDLDREFDTLGVLKQKTAPLREILRQLRITYCRRIGVEYMYINDVNEKTWLQNKVEKTEQQFSLVEKKSILSKLLQAEGFEHFLHKRYLGHKRFSMEGAESTIPVLNELLDGAACHGVTD
ncbi:MAG: 2-oxo acid dehydrogenase subunit E2, partial [bacterium]|nr:2-oxo acid dehydrogenase subunit E2 [bacterium]